MNRWRLIRREIIHRKGNFLLGLTSILVAVGSLVGSLLALRGHDLRTEQIIGEKEEETGARMKKLEDDYRKITKNMGFNVLVLNKDQNLGDLYAEGFPTTYMPEEYANRLAESRIVTINHLLPSLKQRIGWPEMDDKIILLIGTKGQVPIVHRVSKKPILETVPPGTMVVGYALHKILAIEKGQKVKLLGREFTVSTLHEERGDNGDITVWINLKEAQELLRKDGLINAILALECHCAGDRIALVRKEIASILPNTRVIEYKTKALARAEARNKAAEAAVASLEAEKRNRARLRGEREAFAALLVPLVLLASCVWIGFLALGNARQRAPEIGILRTLGLRSRDILTVFLGRAALMGLVGAGLGYFVGIFVGALWGELPRDSEGSVVLFDPALFLAALFLAPLLAVVATWVPALLAARQDPAVILREV